MESNSHIYEFEENHSAAYQLHPPLPALDEDFHLYLVSWD
jgi:hypothetical protein